MPFLSYGLSNMRPFSTKRTRFIDAVKKIPGLVAYYPMSETTGTSVRYYATSTIGGLVGTTTGATINNTGLIGRSISFDGSNDRVAVSNNANLDAVTGTWFFMIKLNANKSGNGNTIMARNDPGSSASGINIKLDTNNVVGVQMKSGVTDRLSFNSLTQLTTTAWYLVAFTFTNNGECIFYINGTASNSGTMSGTFAFNGQSLLFGENIDSFWADFNGLIQHGGVISRVLTPGEIGKLAHIAGFI